MAPQSASRRRSFVAEAVAGGLFTCMFEAIAAQGRPPEAMSSSDRTGLY
jgi:hypothetical protein